MQEVIEEVSGVAGIVTALVEACKTGISILWAFVFGICFFNITAMYFFSLTGLVGGILLRMRSVELEGGLSSQGDHEDICHHGRFGG